MWLLPSSGRSSWRSQLAASAASLRSAVSTGGGGVEARQSSCRPWNSPDAWSILASAGAQAVVGVVLVDDVEPDVDVVIDSSDPPHAPRVTANTASEPASTILGVPGTRGRVLDDPFGTAKSAAAARAQSPATAWGGWPFPEAV